MNHVILFLYIVLISSGAGGVVALAILHYRLRTRVTGAFLVANSGLLASLLLVLLTFYLDSVVARGGELHLFLYSPVRTIIGYALGVTIYGALAYAIRQLPDMPRLAATITVGVVIGAMTVQTAVIVTGRLELAERLGPLYMYVVSACLVVLGFLIARHSVGAKTPTMTWFLSRLGYVTAGFGLLSAGIYTLFYLVPILEEFSFSLDFLYYLIWSALSIVALIRYLTRPSALNEQEEISEAFITAFGITKREREIVQLIGRGLTNQEIADNLGISFTTVRTHVYNIFQKTGAGGRVDLLRLAAGYRE